MTSNQMGILARNDMRFLCVASTLKPQTCVVSCQNYHLNCYPGTKCQRYEYCPPARPPALRVPRSAGGLRGRSAGPGGVHAITLCPERCLRPQALKAARAFSRKGGSPALPSGRRRARPQGSAAPVARRLETRGVRHASGSAPLPPAASARQAGESLARGSGLEADKSSRPAPLGDGRTASQPRPCLLRDGAAVSLTFSRAGKLLPAAGTPSTRHTQNMSPPAQRQRRRSASGGLALPPASGSPGARPLLRDYA